MKKTLLLVAAASLAVLSSSNAAFTASFATVNGSFYDLNATTGNPDFSGADLGTFDSTISDQLLLGGELNIVGGNVEFARVGWGVRDSSNNLVVAFSETGGSFDSVQSGNDRWVLSGGSRPDVISGLDSGDYTLEVYLHGKYNGGGDFFESNSNNNFIGSFTVVPEPSSTALLGLGGLALILRRRK